MPKKKTEEAVVEAKTEETVAETETQVFGETVYEAATARAVNTGVGFVRFKPVEVAKDKEGKSEVKYLANVGNPEQEAKLKELGYKVFTS